MDNSDEDYGMDVDLEEMDVDIKPLGEKSRPVSQDDRGRRSHEGEIDSSALKNAERSSQHSRKRKGEDVSNENFQAKKPKREDSGLKAHSEPVECKTTFRLGNENITLQIKTTKKEQFSGITHHLETSATNIYTYFEFDRYTTVFSKN